MDLEDLLRIRPKVDDAVTTLGAPVELVVNIKVGGLVHRLAKKSSRSLPREKRKSQCGWKVGSPVANVRFLKTSRWPPCQTLCSRCFPSAPKAKATTTFGGENEDHIED